MQEKRLSVTRNGFLEIFCEAPQQTLTQRILQTLEDHQLVRKLIPEGNGSLMKAISDQLYFSSLRGKEIQEKCIQYAHDLIISKSIPNKLKSLKTVFEQFKQDPSNLMFDNINLELVSLIYKVRVIVYSMSKELVLKSLLFNNRCSKTIQLINMSNHYDSIYSEEEISNLTQCQNIVYDILSEQPLCLGKKLDQSLLNNDYDNYLEEITKISDQENEDLANTSENDQAGYNLFDNNMPPELFNVILDKERRNSIVEYVRHKKSTICNSANQSNQSQQSPLQTEQNKAPLEKKKGVGVSLEAVKNRIIGSDSEKSSDSEDDEDTKNNLNKQIEITKVDSVVSQASNNNNNNNNNNTVQINVIQDEDYKLIQEATDLKRPRQESTASYNGANLSNSSLSNQASFQAFSCQNLSIPQQTMKHSSSNPQIQYPNSRPLSPSNNNQETYPNKSSSQYQQNQFGSQQTSSLSSNQQHHQQGIYSMTDLQHPNNSTGLQTNTASFTNSNSSTPPLAGMEPQLTIQQQQLLQQQQLQQQLNQGNFLNPVKRKHLVIESSKEKYKGTLKFFDQDKNYGFIVEDDSRTDIFVHFDDLQKAGIHKGILMDHKHSKAIRFQFSMMDYVGKYQNSRKAVDLQLLSDAPPYLPMNPNQLRVLTPDQYLTTYPPYYPAPNPVIHSPTSTGSADYFASPYQASYLNHATLMPPAANHLIPIQPPLSPTAQAGNQFQPVIHYNLGVPPQQVVAQQYQNLQLSPSQMAMHHPPSPQMSQAQFPVQQVGQQAQQHQQQQQQQQQPQIYYNNNQQQQQGAQLPYQNLVI